MDPSTCTRAADPAARRPALALALVSALLASGAGAALAFVRLSTDGSGDLPLAWAPGALPVPFAIDPVGSDDIPLDASEAAVIRLGFDTWAARSGGALAFREVAFASTRQAAYDGHNLVFFDETDATGLFAGASSIVALTPVTYSWSGEILDADIVFNGRDHRFTTDPFGASGTGRFDVGEVATHEIGHLLGLDHTGVLAATMLPTVATVEVRLRSLDLDDLAGLASAYPPPAGAATGALSGTVETVDGHPVGGAHIVATSATSGAPTSGTVTGFDGRFVVPRLPPGGYRVLVEPLDGPLDPGDLQRGEADTGFTTRYLGSIDAPSEAMVATGATTAVGTLTVGEGSGFNVSGAFPRQIRRGQTTRVVLQSPSGPANLAGAEVEVVGGAAGGLTWSPTVATDGAITVTASALAPAQAHDIVLRKGSLAREMVALPGGIEVIVAPPEVLAVSPDEGPAAGGTVVEVSGTGFVDGARVRFGDALVPATSTVFVDATRLQVTTPAAGGVRAVVVVHPDGQEDRLDDGFTFVGAPPPPPPLPTDDGLDDGGGGGCGIEPEASGYGEAAWGPGLALLLSLAWLHLRRRRRAGPPRSGAASPPDAR